jgi:DNA-directed RNA polymerase subunit RPC12/RpoP
MLVEVSCPNIGYGGKLCGYSFQSSSDRDNYTCPACGQLVNVKKLVEQRKYKLVKM